MSDNDQREFQLAFHDQCCPEGSECRNRSIHAWTYSGWFDGEEYLNALPASLLQASLDGRTQAGSDATTRTNARATTPNSARGSTEAA